MIDTSDRLLMSDSLLGMVPELETESVSVSKFSDSFIVATLDFTEAGIADILVGSISGLSIENNSTEIKLDIRVNIDEAFGIIKKFKTTGLSCRMFYMHLDDDEIVMEGPFKFSSPKIMNFDHQNKMCTLGVDLIKFGR
jgi:hypothetical protein